MEQALSTFYQPGPNHEHNSFQKLERGLFRFNPLQSSETVNNRLIECLDQTFIHATKDSQESLESGSKAEMGPEDTSKRAPISLIFIRLHTTALIRALI